MPGIIQESFKINLRLMAICHLYPPDEDSFSFKIRAYLLQILLIMPAPILGILYLLLENDLDMDKVNYNAGFLAQTACFITKLLPFVSNGRRIKKCIDYFDQPFFRPVRDDHKGFMLKCIRICKRNTLIFLFCVTGGVGSWASKPFFWEGRQLPVDIWLPFGITSNFLSYCCVYVFLTTGVLFVSFATGVIDPLIAGLAYHATTQIKILKDNLQHLNDYAEEELRNPGGNKSTKNKIIYENIKRCVIHHNAILSFVQEYEKCFSSTVLSQFAGSVFVIGFSCLQLSKIESLGYYLLQLVMYFSVILAQIFFYCYYGSALFEESNTLNNAIYMGEWYDYDMKSRKALITLMERSKEPVIITVAPGKILDLSLTTFAMILRRSYSFIAVLKNYQ